MYVYVCVYVCVCVCMDKAVKAWMKGLHASSSPHTVSGSEVWCTCAAMLSQEVCTRHVRRAWFIKSLAIKRLQSG